MRLNRTILLLVFTACLMAEAAGDAVRIEGLPPVPNPFGFDDRLALRVHLEEVFHQRDLAERSYEELVALYRSLSAPPPPIPATRPTPAPRAVDQGAAEERIRRANIMLQLQRQFHLVVDETASTDVLDLQLRDLIDAERNAREIAPTTRDDESEQVDPPIAAKAVTPAAPAALTSIAALDLKRLKKPAGLVSGLVVDNDGDHLVGVCFNASLSDQLPLLLRAAAGSMAAAKQAKTCLILLGHGDGINIGVGENPVNLTDHLKGNREAYHTLLGTQQIDCVAFLSCSKNAYAQFTSFRDGLGYYPTWRVSSWEHTYQNAISGLSALQLALAQDRTANFRAAVFSDEQQLVGSLSEVGERASISFFSVTQTPSGMVLTPVRRKR